MSLLLNDAEKMDRDSKITERILNLTLEIIHLLTGEDYILTKKMFDKDKEWSKHQTPITLSPSLKNKRSNVQKILVITNKITELLTGEVPIRCQDVTVYFSMEEWDYLEEHKDLYRDIVMEEHQPPVSKESIIKNVPEEPSTIPQSCSEENSEVLEDDQVDGAEMPPNAVEYLTTIKGEVMSRDEEIYEVVIQQCKEEEIPVDISPDDRTKTLEEHLLLAPDYTADYYDTYGAHCITTNIPSTFHSRDLSSDPTSYMEPSSDQSQNEQQVTGHRGDDCTKTQEEHHLSPDCEAEYNNIPQYNFINTHKVSVLHKRDLYSYPNIHKESASDESQNDQQVTGDRGVKIFTCTECGKQFKKKLSFYAHRRNHRSGKPFSCSDCGKSFKNKSDLTRHQRIHSGVKPFSCSECGKCFTVKSHLVDHQKIHTGEKPFSCSECGNCFARKSNLQRHQRTHTGVKAYYCSECGKSFTMKSDFIDHQKTHIVEKPFSCLQCGKCFTLKAELIGHMRIHTEEKQYTCPDCGKCFTQKLALVNHQQLHSDEVCMFRL